MSDEKKFYVYVHRKLSDGRIFYVGKGHGKRLIKRSGRSERWHRVVSKHGRVAEKVCDGMTECCAFTLEKIMIHKIGISNLVNATTGGEGATGSKRSQEYVEYIRKRMTGKNNPMYGVSKCISEEHKKAISIANSKPKPPGFGENVSKRVRGTKASDETRLKISLALKGRPSHRKGKSGVGCGRFDATTYKFYHEVYGVVVSTTQSLEKKYNLPKGTIRLVVRGINKHTKGWRVAA